MGESLVSYETENYRADLCRITYTNVTLVMFLNLTATSRDLSNGAFNLKIWLRRVRRVAQDLSDIK